jgi:hypothetical protein
VDKGGQVRDLLRGKLEGRHAFIGTSVQDDLANLVSAHVRCDQLRPGKIRPGFTAAGIAAMAKRAVLLECGAARGHGGSRRSGIAPVAWSSILSYCRSLAGGGIDM